MDNKITKKFPFYTWKELNEVRLMCSFDTTELDIEQFIDEIENICR